MKNFDISAHWRAQPSRRVRAASYGHRHRVRLAIFVAACATAALQCGCGTAGSTSSSPPPSSVSVTVQPASASVFLGGTQQFQAAVTGRTNTNVTWDVNGVSGGSASAGTISASGLYTAPATLPSPASVTVTAVSQADAQARASASVTLQDDVVVTVSPATATVPTGGEQVFTANISGTSGFATGVNWSVNEIAGGNATVGTIASTGSSGGSATAVYTAPAAPPSPATVTVTATSAADSSKSGSASATITCATADSISPVSASVALGQTQSFTASFCIAAGASIAWDVNGVAGGDATVGTISPTSGSGGATAVYTAPAALPAANPVTIHATATPPSGGTATVSAAVTITSNVSVSVSPNAATLSPGQRATFTPSVTNSSDTSVAWSVDGIANGNATVGQVCQLNSDPCVAPTAPGSESVDYLAPASAPPTNPVTLTATSHADPSRSGSASILISVITGPVSVTIAPPYAFVPPSGGTLGTKQFFATVTGTTNTAVTWSVASAVAGQGCAGAACGSVNASGLYTAPTVAPSPNAISVIATSQADPTKSASATVALTSGPVIEVLLPSSAMAGAVQSLPLAVRGANFVAGSGSAASVILLKGALRTTTCATANACTTALNPTDVQAAGTLTIQVQNPGTPSALSNPVPFVIVPFDVSTDTISLSASQPVAAGKDIVAVEPTTAASSSPIGVDFIGLLTGGNTCGVQGSPLTVARPSSGSTTVSLCVHGTGLDPTFTYAFTGPGGAPGGADIGVTASAVTGLFPNVIELDLQISSTTLPGVRTLFITTLNNDRAVATGMLEVK
jgi:hypothetical protein